MISISKSTNKELKEFGKKEWALVNIDHYGKQIVVGGLGGVGVQKEFRGRGISTQMLAKAREILDQSDCDIAFLGTDLNDPQMLKIYGRIGFVPLNKAFRYVGRSGKLYEDKESGMIAPIHSQKLFEEILKSKEPFNIGVGTW
jgi:ribosomal protein S18 acetylase RimI-like enzyme